MTAESATLAGRRAAEALMVDACTVTRPGGRGTYNPAALTYTTALPSVLLYSGKCRLRRNAPTDQHPEGGERAVGVGEHLVTVPMTTTGITLDDVVTVTASALDPSLVGLRLRVTAVTKGSHVTARRLICEELVA